MKDTYLSDEQLLQFMEQVESEEMVTAPEYLEENVMNTIRKLEEKENIISYQEQVREPHISSPKKPPRNKKRELTVYAFKVSFVAVASILILFIVPVSGNREKPVSKALGQINQTTSNIFSYINQSTTKMITNQGGINYDKEEK